MLFRSSSHKDDQFWFLPSFPHFTPLPSHVVEHIYLLGRLTLQLEPRLIIEPRANSSHEQKYESNQNYLLSTLPNIIHKFQAHVKIFFALKVYKALFSMDFSTGNVPKIAHNLKASVLFRNSYRSSLSNVHGHQSLILHRSY